MTEQPKQMGGGRRAIGDIAPKLAELTDAPKAMTAANVAKQVFGA